MPFTVASKHVTYFRMNLQKKKKKKNPKNKKTPNFETRTLKTMWELGAPTPCPVENPLTIFDFPKT